MAETDVPDQSSSSLADGDASGQTWVQRCAWRGLGATDAPRILKNVFFLTHRSRSDVRLSRADGAGARFEGAPDAAEATDRIAAEQGERHTTSERQVRASQAQPRRAESWTVGAGRPVAVRVGVHCRGQVTALRARLMPGRFAPKQITSLRPSPKSGTIETGRDVRHPSGRRQT